MLLSVYFFCFHFVFLFPCRPFTIPQVLRKGNKPVDDDEGEDEEEEENIPVLKSFRNGRSNITEKIFFFFLAHFKAQWAQWEGFTVRYYILIFFFLPVLQLTPAGVFMDVS